MERYILAASFAILAGWLLLGIDGRIERGVEWLADEFGEGQNDREIVSSIEWGWVWAFTMCAVVVAWA